VLSGLSALVIVDIEGAGPGGGLLGVRRGDRVHGYHVRTAAAVSWCGSAGCAARFRVARGRRSASRSRGVLDRYQRRTMRLTGQVSAVLANYRADAGARLLPYWAS
jgi:hypothetical protein